MTFPYATATDTPRRYQFILKSSRPDVILDKEPLEWKEGVLQFARDMYYGGVFISYQVQSLTILGNGAKLLKELFDANSINAECNLHIYYFDFLTRAYVEFPTSFAAKFISYKLKKVGKFAIGVNMEFIQSSTYSKIVDRGKVKLNLLKRFEPGSANIATLGGAEIADYADFDLLKKVKIPAITNTFSATLEKLYKYDSFWYTNYKFLPDGYDDGYNSIPLVRISSDIAEVDSSISFERGKATLTEIDALFDNATEEKTILFVCDVTIDVTDGGGANHKDCFQLRVAQVTSGGLATETTLYSFGQHTAERRFKGAHEFTLAAGDSIKFYLWHEGYAQGPFANYFEAVFKSASVRLYQTVANTTDAIVEGLPIYETLNRACQLMLDESYPFYSEFFGRTDSPYKSDGTCYSSESQLRFAHIGSGEQLRGLPIESGNANIDLSWEQIFKSINGLYCIGMGLEKIESETKYRVRVEEYGYFFDDTTEVLDLSSRISAYDIEQEYMGDMAYINLKAGFENFVYRSTNGRGEYNTETTRTTILNTDGELDLKSEIRGDTTGIINCLEKQMDTYGSEDIDEDNDVFILKTQRDEQATHKWITEADTDNITIENNSSLFGNSSLNLYYTPTRNLIRNAPRFMPALLVKTGGVYGANSAKIRFQTAGKLATLETSGEGYTGGLATIVENQDIKVSDLPLPKFVPIKLIFTCKVSMTDIAAITANPRGYITLSSTLAGYIMNVKKKNAEDKATFELIQKI